MLAQHRPDANHAAAGRTLASTIARRRATCRMRKAFLEVAQRVQGPQDFALARSANLQQLREHAMSDESVQLEEVLSLDDEVALSETSVPRTDVMVAELEPARASTALRLLTAQFPLHPIGLRSEERRVGKECRSRWSPYH